MLGHIFRGAESLLIYENFGPTSAYLDYSQDVSYMMVHSFVLTFSAVVGL